MKVMREQWEDWYATDPVGAIRACLVRGDEVLPPEAQLFVDSLLASGMPPEAALPAPSLAARPTVEVGAGEVRSFSAQSAPASRRPRLERSALGLDA